MRYALARYWDEIARGGNDYMLNQAGVEVLRVENHGLPPKVIATNRGDRLYWEAEYEKMIRLRFKIDRGALATAVIPEMKHKPKVSETKWSDRYG